MREKSIVGYIEERLENGGIELPVFDRVAIELQEMIAKDDFSAKDMARIIQRDQALTSQALKMANSSFYYGLHPVSTISDAIVRLGVKSIVNMVMVVTQKKSYYSLKPSYKRWSNPLWIHSLTVAVASKWLANNLGLNSLAEESFLAGLLHDIGKLLLLKIIEELQDSDPDEWDLSDSVIDDILESLHCERGEQLMRQSNMPELYCQVVLSHDSSEVSGNNPAINIVRLANLTCHKLGIGLKYNDEIMLSATSEAISLMASDLLLAELQVELEGYQKNMENMLGLA